MASRSGVLSSQGATVAAALIGAVLGSIGGVLLEGLLEIRQRESVARESLVQRYVYDLQEGAESLWWRVRNADKHGGVTKMPDEYYVTSTMYALCRVLAADRILVVEGVYPRLLKDCPPLGTSLNNRRLGKTLANRNVYRYTRLALAESLIESRGSALRTTGYLKFRSIFDLGTWSSDPLLAPAIKFIREMGAKDNKELLETLAGIVQAAENCTGVSAHLGS